MALPACGVWRPQGGLFSQPSRALKCCPRIAGGHRLQREFRGVSTGNGPRLGNSGQLFSRSNFRYENASNETFRERFLTAAMHARKNIAPWRENRADTEYSHGDGNHRL
jgi:hypothetical protein